MRRVLIIAATASLALAACTKTDRTPGASPSDGMSSGTLASAISDNGELATLKSALSDTQLAPVLDGKAEYTLLAPDDAAFKALGDDGKSLSTPEKRPVLAAILRGHVLPGAVTPESILAAVDRKKGPVQMMTMGGSPVSFSREGSDLLVSNGKLTAKVEGKGTQASNGQILTIDRVLVP